MTCLYFILLYSRWTAVDHTSKVCNLVGLLLADTRAIILPIQVAYRRPEKSYGSRFFFAGGTQPEDLHPTWLGNLTSLD